MSTILVAGPAAAQPFLENLVSSIDRDEHDVEFAFGVQRPMDAKSWKETEILIAFGVPCDRNDMDAAPRLLAIIVPSLGYEGIDVQHAHRRSIAFANGRVEENFESVAEAAILFILASLYRLRDAETRLRDNVSRTGPPRARMLKGKTIGIIGYGNIARALVRRLVGWDVEVRVSNRSSIALPEGIRQVALDDLLVESDILVPLVPLTDETSGLLSRERLLSMKEGAILINLSRGAIIDEAALTEDSVAGHLGPLALDVFCEEPLPIDSPLRELPDTILVNHEISHTQENLGALLAMARRNIEAALENLPMPTAINFN